MVSSSAPGVHSEKESPAQAGVHEQVRTRARKRENQHTCARARIGQRARHHGVSFGARVQVNSNSVKVLIVSTICCAAPAMELTLRMLSPMSSCSSGLALAL
mmetsp:Transcript_9607/g.34115  ORF Transcript_9607/g.34115 Transcript_9607/m.34115 type:complete len:102 (-) Transcript_9607:667-972(-)